MKVVILTTDNRDHSREHHKVVPWFGPAPEALLQGFQGLPEVELHVVSCARQPMSSPEKLADNIWFHSLRVPRIGWMRTGYLGCIRATRKKLRELQPDIVHGQGTELDCGMTAVFSGFPNVLTIHGNMQSIAKLYRSRIGSYYWMAGKLETITVRRTSGVLCNSAYTEHCVKPYARQVWRVPNALRPAFFDRPKEPPAAGPPILLNIGSTLAYKQQAEILEVAGTLWRQGLKFKLHFAGDRALHTKYGAAFAQRLAAAERAGHARHLGMLDTAQLIAAMDAASALVHFPTEESFGLVVAEALARNLKLFGATTGGMVDIASGVEGAELFPAGDFAALASALARWLNAGCPLPRTAAATMGQRYHPIVVARRHLEIYQEVLGKTEA